VVRLKLTGVRSEPRRHRRRCSPLHESRGAASQPCGERGGERLPGDRLRAYCPREVWEPRISLVPAARRRRLTTLLAGFCVAEEAVSEELAPFADAAKDTSMASEESLVAWVFFLQRRDEQRHALLFDRIAAEVLGLPGATPAERRAAARAHVPDAVLELFVLDAGQRALLDDLADGARPGVREGVARVERDERWHVGLGLRCLIEAQPSSTTCWRGPRTPPRPGATPSPPPRARAARASARTGCTSPDSSRRTRRRSWVVNGRRSGRRAAPSGRALIGPVPRLCSRRNHMGRMRRTEPLDAGHAHW
jgi:hypothetical protein